MNLRQTIVLLLVISLANAICLPDDSVDEALELPAAFEDTDEKINKNVQAPEVPVAFDSNKATKDILNNPRTFKTPSLRGKIGGSNVNPGRIGGSENNSENPGGSNFNPGRIGGSDNNSGTPGGSNFNPGRIGGSDNNSGNPGGSNVNPGRKNAFSMPNSQPSMHHSVPTVTTSFSTDSVQEPMCQCTCQVPPKSRPNFINRSQFKPKPDSNSARPDFIENGRPNFENDEQNRPDFNPARPGFDSSQFKPRPDFNSARPDFIQNGRPNFENDNQSSRPDFNPGRPNFDTSTSTRKLFLKPKIGQSASQSDPVDLLFVPLNDNAGY